MRTGSFSGVAAGLVAAALVAGCAPEVAERPSEDEGTSQVEVAQRPSPTASREPSSDPGVGEQRILDERLRDAAWANDVAAVRRLVARGADRRQGQLERHRPDPRRRAWSRSCRRGVLQAGIDRDHVNRIGYQAIHEAVWLGEDTASYATTVRVLAAGEVRLSDRSVTEGLTPLEMARQREFDGLERVLTELTTYDAPAEPDATLLRAAAAGDADAVARALRAGADIEARDEHERTALLLAATYDHVTALEHAERRGYDGIARLLRR